MRRLLPAILLGCAGVLALSAAQAAIRRIPEANAASPYSAATVAGDFIYVTGNGGGNAKDIGAATNQALDNIAAILKKAGADLGDVVQTQVFLTERANAAGMDEAYAARFSKNPPARIVVVTCLVGCRGLVEINAIAVRHGMAHRAVLPKGWQKPSGPFSYGEKAGNTLFISGLDARNPTDGSAATPGNIGVQTKTIMDNLGAVLKAGGMDYNDVAAGRVWIADMKQYQGLNAVYRTYYVQNFPARATLRFDMVNPEDMALISAIAVKGGPRKAIAAAINADGSMGKPNPNYSAGMVVGNRMWITGMTGQTADNKTDIGAQAKEALARMLRVLKAGGFNQNQVVEVNCFIGDIKDPKTFQAMNAGYKEVFQKDLPARTTVQGVNAGNSLVEITMMAAR